MKLLTELQNKFKQNAVGDDLSWLDKLNIEAAKLLK